MTVSATCQFCGSKSTAEYRANPRDTGKRGSGPKWIVTVVCPKCGTYERLASSDTSQPVTIRTPRSSPSNYADPS
jgi:hypothetical protein